MSYSRTTWIPEETPLSAENFNNIEDGVEEALNRLNGLETNTSLFEAIYPVGSIYMSTSSTNPAAYFGGTWVAWGAGRVPVGVNASDTNFNTVEKTGGEKNAIIPSHSHTFTGNQLPAHTHAFTGTAVGNHTHTGPSHTHTGPSHAHEINEHSHQAYGTEYFVTQTTDSQIKSISLREGTGSYSYPFATDAGNRSLNLRRSTVGVSLTTKLAGTGNTGAAGTGATGAAGAHTPAGTNRSVSAGTPAGTISTVGEAGANKNLQPYITCYMWKRTA